MVWLTRGAKSQPLKRLANDPLKERDRLAARANTLATRGEGNVEFHPQSPVEAVEWLGPDKGFQVTARIGGKPKTWEVERVIGNVGYTPDASLYRELQVHECYASLGPMALAASLLEARRRRLPEHPGAGAERAAKPGAELLHPRGQELRAQLELPAARRLRAGARRVRARHGEGGPRPVPKAIEKLPCTKWVGR